MLQELFTTMKTINEITTSISKSLKGMKDSGTAILDLKDYLSLQQKIIEAEKKIHILDLIFNRMETARQCFELCRQSYHQLVVEKLEGINNTDLKEELDEIEEEEVEVVTEVEPS